MTAWAKGGPYPFKDSKLLRGYYFQEKKELWVKGKPKMSDMDLFRAICKAKKIKI